MQTITSRAVRWQAICYKVANRWRHWRSPQVRQVRDNGRSGFYPSVWEEAAAAVGAAITFPDEYFAEIHCPGTVLRVRNHLTSLDDLVTQAIAGNKPLVNRLLGQRGLPVPRFQACRFDDVRAGWAFVATLGRPCVVKPARGTGGGTGITTRVSSRRALMSAMARAGGYCYDVIIEEQVPGDDYRLLYLDGELLDALERRPPTLSGDGHSSIEQLIEAENERRLQRGAGIARSPFAIDHELRQTLREAGRQMSSIPTSGELVRLRTVVNQNAQSNASAKDRVCSALAEAGAQAAAAVGVRLAGVDVITTDPSVPLNEAGGAIIEVNTTPGLHYHYMVAGEPTPVVLLILQRLCETAP
jgi:D-alanine-D-alanine ligase-like ATP-grasp enzyme